MVGIDLSHCRAFWRQFAAAPSLYPKQVEVVPQGQIRPNLGHFLRLTYPSFAITRFAMTRLSRKYWSTAGGYRWITSSDLTRKEEKKQKKKV